MSTAQSATTIWLAALGRLQLQVTRPSFDTWLKGTVGLTFEGGDLIVGTRHLSLLLFGPTLVVHQQPTK